jgi:hypothetical protein
MTNLTEQNKQKGDISPELIDTSAFWNIPLPTPLPNTENTNKQEHSAEDDAKGMGKKHKEYAENAMHHQNEETLKEKQQETNKMQQNNAKFSQHEVIKHYLNTLLKSDDIHGLIIQSQPGMGKTHQTQTHLETHDYKHEQDYTIIKGHITPLKLHQTLHENKDKIIIIDDINTILHNKQNNNHLPVFLSALDTYNKREVTWRTTSKTLDTENTPHHFTFTGKIIFCTNHFPQELSPLKDRCYYYALSFNHKEKLELIKQVAAARKIPQEVVEFITENTNETHKDLSLRTLIRIANIHKNNKHWRRLAALELKADEELILIKEMMLEGLSTTDQIRRWTEETGKSRRTFYNKRKLLVQ